MLLIQSNVFGIASIIINLFSDKNNKCVYHNGFRPSICSYIHVQLGSFVTVTICFIVPYDNWNKITTLLHCYITCV